MYFWKHKIRKFHWSVLTGKHEALCMIFLSIISHIYWKPITHGAFSMIIFCLMYLNQIFF